MEERLGNDSRERLTSGDELIGPTVIDLPDGTVFMATRRSHLDWVAAEWARAEELQPEHDVDAGLSDTPVRPDGTYEPLTGVEAPSSPADEKLEANAAAEPYRLPREHGSTSNLRAAYRNLIEPQY